MKGVRSIIGGQIFVPACGHGTVFALHQDLHVVYTYVCTYGLDKLTLGYVNLDSILEILVLY